MSATQAILNGDRLALARLLTKVENNTAEGRDALIELFPHTGRAHLIGVTGAPGTGKSSLDNQLALRMRLRSSTQRDSTLSSSRLSARGKAKWILRASPIRRLW